MIRIAVIACNETEDIELLVPVDLWRRVGFRVDIISLEKKNSIVLQSGTKISCNNSIDRTNIAQYNAIYLPGGNGHKKYFIDAWPIKNNDNVTKLHKFLVKFDEEKEKYILSMCAAPSILLELNIIKNNKYTCYPGYQGNGKNYVNQPVVIDDKLITGRSPGCAFDFAYAVIKTFENDKVLKDLIEVVDHK